MVSGLTLSTAYWIAIFSGGQSQQISVQNDITSDEPPADPRQNYSGDQTAVFQHILPVIEIAAVFLLLQKDNRKSKMQLTIYP